MRPIIYPETEELIRNKKQQKFQVRVEEERQFSNRRRGKRKKDTPEEKKAKADARKRRRIEQDSSFSGPVCKSCGQPGHTTSASRLCPNHEYTIKERLGMIFPTSYQLLIYGKITIEELQNFYPRLPGIQEAYNHLQALENDNHYGRTYVTILGTVTISSAIVNLLVEKEGLVGYGQIVSSACDTVATAYNNFYVENYETYIGNYFIYRLKQEYTNIKMPLVKKVVYDYVLDEVLKNDTRSDMLEDFITQDGLNSAPNLQAFLNDIIQPVRNRAPRLPLSREGVTKNPFIVLSIMTYIIEFYERVNIQLQENAQPEQSEELLEQTTDNPRGLACFLFFQILLKIGNLTELQELPRQKRRTFLNSIYTDEYTCRISFARNVPETLEEDKVNLEIADFNADEIENFFRPCFLDPGRKNAYAIYYGNEQVRSLTINEYYCSSGSVNRARKQNTFKTEQGIKVLETQIPTTKTSSVDSYINYLTYVLTHLRRFFFFFLIFMTSEQLQLNGTIIMEGNVPSKKLAIF
ncbi:hypothetical protein INT48_009348 [Thamnidium elegans]|uniref:Uncharacterized protein n=1 Tax=Thamnidium elegans TaxID=101142 RepID=A0A8H7SIF9_9FUNG|nr:hypothetical protein INT48_009348 [Thamnidium elegans]